MNLSDQYKDNVSKNRPSKIWSDGRQSFLNFTWSVLEYIVIIRDEFWKLEKRGSNF